MHAGCLPNPILSEPDTGQVLARGLVVKGRSSEGFVESASPVLELSA